MAKIIDITKHKKFLTNQTNWIIDQHLYHPDPQVLKIWQSLARATLEQYSGIPHLQPLNITLPRITSTCELKQISTKIQNHMQNYINEVKKNTLSMLSEIIYLQKEIAEHRSSN